MDSNIAAWGFATGITAGAILLAYLEMKIARKLRTAVSLQMTLASNPTNEGNTMSNLIVKLSAALLVDVIKFTFRDAAEHVTQHHGAVVVSGDSPQLFSVSLNDDGNGATVTAASPLVAGQGTITVTDAADNILVTALVIVDDGSGEATSLTLSDAASDAAALSTDAPAALSTDEAPALSTDDVAALGTDQVAALTGGDVSQ